MRFWKNKSDEMLDRAAAEIREMPIERGVVNAARERVWARLSEELEGTGPSAAPAGAIRECAGLNRFI